MLQNENYRRTLEHAGESIWTSTATSGKALTIESAWTTQRASRGHGEGEAARICHIATSLIMRLQVGLIAASFGNWEEKGLNLGKTFLWAVYDIGKC